MEPADMFLKRGEVLAALHLLEQVALGSLLSHRKRLQHAMTIEQLPDFLGPRLDICG
jgi:hypothetical protein